MPGALDCGLGLLHGGDRLVDRDLVLHDADDRLRGADVQALELDDHLRGKGRVLHRAGDLPDGASGLVDGDLAGVDGGAELVGELGEAGHQAHRPAEGADGGASSQTDELSLLRAGLERLLAGLLALGLLGRLLRRAGSGGFLPLAERLLGDAPAELVGLGLGLLHLGDRVGSPADLGVVEGGLLLGGAFGLDPFPRLVLRFRSGLPFRLKFRLDGRRQRGADLLGPVGDDRGDGPSPFPSVKVADIEGAAGGVSGDVGLFCDAGPVRAVRLERLDEPQIQVLAHEAFGHRPTPYPLRCRSRN